MDVTPLETRRVDLVRDQSGVIHWTGHTNARRYPEGFSLQSLLLNREPSTVTQPLDFTGLSDNRLALVSIRGFSWTDTQYKFHGLDATDSYQPGFPALAPDIFTLENIVTRGAFARPTSSAYATEVGLYLAEPRESWHGAVSTIDGGDLFAWSNLPPLPERGLVQQPGLFHWFTRDHAELGGPLGKRVDLYASASGQWSSQTEPLGPPATDQRSRLLYGNARGRVRATSNDRFDALYSGSRIDLSDGGLPAGLEALTSNRMAPSFVLPGGFFGQPETDHLDAIQVGWTHLPPAGSIAAQLEVRYGYSIAHLDTHTPPAGQSRVELLGGAVTGSPPLANLAVRPRHEIAASWQPALLRARATRHQIAAGGDWKTSEPRNRFRSPSDSNLITANGVAAFIVDFNTPRGFRCARGDVGRLCGRPHHAPALALARRRRSRRLLSRLASASIEPGGHIHAGSQLRRAVRPNRLEQRIATRRARLAGSAFAWAGASRRLLPALLAARGQVPRFRKPQQPGRQRITSPRFKPLQRGGLVLRFGGPYSSIAPALRRPYSDEFDLGAGLRIGPAIVASIHLFRRDEKNRIAAVDTGIPAQAFTPVPIQDPGPDGIPGTFDDQTLTVYAQDPTTFGQDRYSLTNPPGLRELNSGVVAETGTQWRGLGFHASFTAEKSYGPTNPGNSFYENDPGVIGALFLDPNTSVNADRPDLYRQGLCGKGAGGVPVTGVLGWVRVGQRGRLHGRAGVCPPVAGDHPAAGPHRSRDNRAREPWRRQPRRIRSQLESPDQPAFCPHARNAHDLGRYSQRDERSTASAGNRPQQPVVQSQTAGRDRAVPFRAPRRSLRVLKGPFRNVSGHTCRAGPSLIGRLCLIS